MTIRVSGKGWVVIPAELRKKYKIKPGSEVQVIDYGGVLAIIPISHKPIEDSIGILAGQGPSLTEALIHEHRQELEGERN